METRSIYVSAGGTPQTGKSLTWLTLKRVSDGNNQSQPSIVEVGGGWYRFDVTVPLGEQWAGVVDAGASLTVGNERYIPILIGDSDITGSLVPIVTPVYDEPSDTLMFMCLLLRNGQLVMSGSMASATVIVYDSTHTELFTLTGNSSTNGVFVLSKVTPGMNSGEGYYCRVVIVAGSLTLISTETIITLD